MILKDWRCPHHGDFESTHPICNGSGCDSAAVTQIHLRPPAFKSDATKRFDAGIAKTAAGMNLTNLRSARAGEAARGGEAAKAAGTELLWGDDTRKILGQSFSQLTQKAAQPFVYQKEGQEPIVLTENNGMREAARAARLTDDRHAMRSGIKVMAGTELTVDKDSARLLKPAA